jgi:membrane protein DedA with SNARE-associated domain
MDVDVASLVSLSAWAYLVVAGVVALDAVLPVLPSESAVIVAGVLAADGHLHPALVVLAAAAGALAGDGLSYAVGRRVSRAGRSVDDLGGRVGRAMRWAAGALEERGGSVISVARFVPGGRTATTAVAGYVGFPAARFVAAAGTGAVLWSAYAAGIGFLGGAAFEDDPLLAVAGGLAVALAITALIEVTRTLLRRPRKAALHDARAGAASPTGASVTAPAENDPAGVRARPRLTDPAGAVSTVAAAAPAPRPAPSRAESAMSACSSIAPRPARPAPAPAVPPAASTPPVPSHASTPPAPPSPVAPRRGGRPGGPVAPARSSSTPGVTSAAARASLSRGSRTHPSTVSPSCTRPPATVRGPAAASPCDGGPRPVDPPAERTLTCASTADRARPCR